MTRCCNIRIGFCLVSLIIQMRISSRQSCDLDGSFQVLACCFPSPDLHKRQKAVLLSASPPSCHRQQRDLSRFHNRRPQCAQKRDPQHLLLQPLLAGQPLQIITYKSVHPFIPFYLVSFNI